MDDEQVDRENIQEEKSYDDLDYELDEIERRGNSDTDGDGGEEGDAEARLQRMMLLDDDDDDDEIPDFFSTTPAQDSELQKTDSPRRQLRGRRRSSVSSGAASEKKTPRKKRTSTMGATVKVSGGEDTERRLSTMTEICKRDERKFSVTFDQPDTTTTTDLGKVQHNELISPETDEGSPGSRTNESSKAGGNRSSTMSLVESQIGMEPSRDATDRRGVDAASRKTPPVQTQYSSAQERPTQISKGSILVSPRSKRKLVAPVSMVLNRFAPKDPPEPKIPVPPFHAQRPPQFKAAPPAPAVSYAPVVHELLKKKEDAERRLAASEEKVEALGELIRSLRDALVTVVKLGEGGEALLHRWLDGSLLSYTGTYEYLT